VRDDRGWLALATGLAAELRRRAETVGPGERWDNAVAALLVDGDGALLGWATNTGAHNATSHAEVNLALGWLRASRCRLPRDGRVYVTLKPCKMCAGLLWDAAQDPLGLRVVYAQEDPGPCARETVLDAGSMARRRVARSADELRQVLQRRLT
jgi:tRNA(Arg) A34 adenosine deaminase TadA